MTKTTLIEKIERNDNIIQNLWFTTNYLYTYPRINELEKENRELKEMLKNNFKTYTISIFYVENNKSVFYLSKDKNNPFSNSEVFYETYEECEKRIQEFEYKDLHFCMINIIEQMLSLRGASP